MEGTDGCYVRGPGKDCLQEEVAFGTGTEGWAEPKDKKWEEDGQQIGEERGFSGCEAW